jgi:4a-hydroxytetrahydrobiopterin dehydratase
MTLHTTPLLATEEALAAFFAGYPGWTATTAQGAPAIGKDYVFADFSAAMGFAVRVGLYAERHDHHPDLLVSWGKVRVVWSTHDVTGISDKDLAAADACDKL